ncbi:MAG TPA: DMT family transporter [Burkholderiales bacterium]|jgi:drug/metabolite transporter (DMT)-like permease
MAPSDVARLLVLAGLWGGSFVFIRVAVPALGPLWLAFFRVALAFVALFALAVFRRSVPTLRERWRDYLVVGAVNSALPFALYCFAEQYVSASTAAILNATSPFFGALVAALWLKEPLTLRQLSGMALGVAGVAWIVGWHAGPMTQSALIATFACLAAALCYGVGGVYAKVRMTGVPTSAIALYSQLAATLLLAPAALATPLPQAPGLLIALNVVGLAVASTAYAFLLYFRLIANVGPTRALTVTFLIPLFGVLWGVAFLGEPLSSNMLLGGMLILAGTWLATRAARPSGGKQDVLPQTSSAAGPSTCARSSR